MLPVMIFRRSAVLAILVFLPAMAAQAQGIGLTPAAMPTSQTNSVVDLLALMSGHCETLSIAGRKFTCSTVAFAHDDEGRVNFAIVINDPEDSSHVVSFSGENGKRADDNSYELVVDRMMLNSKDQPRVDGLPVPAQHKSAGMCLQTGNFAAKKVSDIKCSAVDDEGRRYELLFISDGSPVTVRRIRQSAPSIQNPFD
ncbi:hypothetical protein QWJ07_32175 [Frankia sp. RB7]|nr:hypothetical protein [Frankia sp. RB7]